MNEDPTREPPPEERRQSSFLMWLMLLPLVGTLGVGVWLVSRPGPEGQGDSFNAFNLSEVPKDSQPKVPTGGPFSAPMPSPKDAAPAAPGGPGLSGFVPESDPLFTAKGGAKGPQTTSQREQDFLKKNDAALRDYQNRVLGPLAARYFKKSAVVREVDAAFGKLGRYMDACAQYQKDRDPYKWARSVAGMPEVRQTVVKYALRPDVWKVAVGMSMEAMKSPPPKAINDEFTRFLSSDKAVGSALSEVTQQIMPNMTALMKQGIPPGLDISPLTKLTGAIVPGGAPPQTQTSPAPPRGGTGRR
ncbi:MAG: hypothetical protein WC969_06165 [Elusimicrobiota bacterium]|jgi:hypothetical protein